MRSTVLAGLLLTVVAASAEEYGAVFLTVYPGSRQCAMSGVGAALAGTAVGVFYNPAGPAFLRSPEASVEVSRIPWGSPTDYWSAAGVVPLLPALNVGVFTSGIHMTFDTESYRSEWDAGVTASTRVSDWLGFGLNLDPVRDTSRISERFQGATRPAAASDQFPGSSSQLMRSANDERCTFQPHCQTGAAEANQRGRSRRW
jgi:hypothetical protein